MSKIEKVVQRAGQLKVDLADKLLKKNNSGAVDVLLGVDSAHFLPVDSCSFGRADRLSLVYCCSVGVMLAEDIDTLIDNLPHFELVSEFITKVHSLS